MAEGVLQTGVDPNGLPAVESDRTAARGDRAGVAGRERAPISRRDAFDRILQSLHAAAFGDARWPAASGLIDEAIGAHGSFLAVAEGPTQNNLFLARMCSRGQRLWELERGVLPGLLPHRRAAAAHQGPARQPAAPSPTR